VYGLFVGAANVAQNPVLANVLGQSSGMLSGKSTPNSIISQGKWPKTKKSLQILWKSYRQ